MTGSGWLIQIYEMTDRDGQELVSGLLAGVDGLTVQAPRNGPDCFLVVECSETGQPWSVYRLVMSVDPRAVLVHTTSGPAVLESMSA